MYKRRVLLLLFLTTFSSISFASDELELRHIKTVLWPQAYLTQDVELLNSLLHDSFEVINDSGERSSKQDELEYIRNNSWNPGNFKYRIDRLDIFDNSFAIVSGTGMADTYTYTSSNALIKENGQWRAVSSHVSGVKSRDHEDQDAWLSFIHASWAEEDNEFKNSPTSPLAGTLRFEISETGTVYFAEKGGQVEWSLEPANSAAFSVLYSEGQWTWQGLTTGTGLTRKDEVLPTVSVPDFGDLAKIGRFTVEFYPVKDTLTALVFDPETQRIREFESLDRYKANPKFALTATIERFENPEQLELVTAIQRVKKRYRYAKLHFEIDGTVLELTAYKHALDAKSLFIPFTDKTTGKYTYGGGRYLIVDEPPEGDEIQIDFNLVTNPLCAYAPIYNCIVPTRENKLPIAIEAGVRKYHEPE
jgi:uncharacterized protein (DUF1684 family)